MAKISTKDMAQALYEATEGKEGVPLKTVLKRSVEILSNKRMLGKAEDVLGALQNIFDKKTRTIRAKITTAKRLGNSDKHDVNEEIKKKYGAKEVVSEFFEKEELLGGMRIEVGDEVLDTTYRNKLNQLSKFLTKEK